MCPKADLTQVARRARAGTLKRYLGYDQQLTQEAVAAQESAARESTVLGVPDAAYAGASAGGAARRGSAAFAPEGHHSTAPSSGEGDSNSPHHC
ncbi:hypothetical_protein [Leishmania major strain Friedlin]|nr:hypothetical_protein [Leishmania major strain Friedlin]